MENNANLAELVRHIQSLKTSKNSNEELDFYETILSVILDTLDSKLYQTIVPIEFIVCSVEKAKELARTIGMYIVEGGSGTLYICWSNGLNN